ncbi:hypothetical protein ACFL56_02600 [Candidatus Margulisiibacteriota bacterium]
MIQKIIFQNKRGQNATNENRINKIIELLDASSLKKDKDGDFAISLRDPKTDENNSIKLKINGAKFYNYFNKFTKGIPHNIVRKICKAMIFEQEQSHEQIMEYLTVVLTWLNDGRIAVEKITKETGMNIDDLLKIRSRPNMKKTTDQYLFVRDSEDDNYIYVNDWATIDIKLKELLVKAEHLDNDTADKIIDIRNISDLFSRRDYSHVAPVNYLKHMNNVSQIEIDNYLLPFLSDISNGKHWQQISICGLATGFGREGAKVNVVIHQYTDPTTDNTIDITYGDQILNNIVAFEQRYNLDEYNVAFMFSDEVIDSIYDTMIDTENKDNKISNIMLKEYYENMDTGELCYRDNNDNKTKREKNHRPIFTQIQRFNKIINIHWTRNPLYPMLLFEEGNPKKILGVATEKDNKEVTKFYPSGHCTLPAALHNHYKKYIDLYGNTLHIDYPEKVSTYNVDNLLGSEMREREFAYWYSINMNGKKDLIVNTNKYKNEKGGSLSREEGEQNAYFNIETAQVSDEQKAWINNLSYFPFINSNNIHYNSIPINEINAFSFSNHNFMPIVRTEESKNEEGGIIESRIYFEGAISNLLYAQGKGQPVQGSRNDIFDPAKKLPEYVLVANDRHIATRLIEVKQLLKFFNEAITNDLRKYENNTNYREINDEDYKNLLNKLTTDPIGNKKFIELFTNTPPIVIRNPENSDLNFRMPFELFENVYFFCKYIVPLRLAKTKELKTGGLMGFLRYGNKDIKSFDRSVEIIADEENGIGATLNSHVRLLSDDRPKNKNKRTTKIFLRKIFNNNDDILSRDISYTPSSNDEKLIQIVKTKKYNSEDSNVNFPLHGKIIPDHNLIINNDILLIYSYDNNFISDFLLEREPFTTQHLKYLLYDNDLLRNNPAEAERIAEEDTSYVIQYLSDQNYIKEKSNSQYEVQDRFAQNDEKEINKPCKEIIVEYIAQKIDPERTKLIMLFLEERYEKSVLKLTNENIDNFILENVLTDKSYGEDIDKAYKMATAPIVNKRGTESIPQRECKIIAIDDKPRDLVGIRNLFFRDYLTDFNKDNFKYTYKRTDEKHENFACKIIKLFDPNFDDTSNEFENFKTRLNELINQTVLSDKEVDEINTQFSTFIINALKIAKQNNTLPHILSLDKNLMQNTENAEIISGLKLAKNIKDDDELRFLNIIIASADLPMDTKKTKDEKEPIIQKMFMDHETKKIHIFSKEYLKEENNQNRFLFYIWDDILKLNVEFDERGHHKNRRENFM